MDGTVNLPCQCLHPGTFFCKFWPWTGKISTSLCLDFSFWHCNVCQNNCSAGQAAQLIGYMGICPLCPCCTPGIRLLYPRCTPGICPLCPCRTLGIRLLYPCCTPGICPLCPSCTPGIPSICPCCTWTPLTPLACFAPRRNCSVLTLLCLLSLTSGLFFLLFTLSRHGYCTSLLCCVSSCIS